MNKKRLTLAIGAIIGLCAIGIIVRNSLQQRRELYSATEYAYSSKNSFTLVDSGLYYIQDSIAHYYDYESKKDVKLEENVGDSYYMDGSIGFVYHNKFYCSCMDINKVENGYAKSSLYSCNLDGSNKRKVIDLTGGIDQFYAYQGKIYYVTCNNIKGFNSEGDYTCNSLHEYDLISKKDKILYEIKPKENEHSGCVQFCKTDDRSKIILYYQYFEGETLTDEQMSDENFDYKQFYKGNFRYYDLEKHQVSRCFTGIDEKHFFSSPILYKGKLYLVESGVKNGKTILQRFTEDGVREVILEADGKESWNSWNGMIYLNSLKKPVLYNVYTDQCYQADKKVNSRIVNFSASRNYVALDKGDYSDLKEGDTYTKSRFVPEVLKIEDFLKDFHLCKKNEVEGIKYYKDNKERLWN